jgi:hypothetical protein
MKTIIISGIEYELTGEKIRRITEAMIETAGKLEKELSRSEDLQHKDMIEFYRSHIITLEGMLA